MKKYIYLPVEQKHKLARLFGVSHVTVWSALNYATDSDRARKIRKAARRLGGVEMCGRNGFHPNCEERCERRTDGSIRRIVQTYAHGVEAVLDYDYQEGRVYQDGVLRRASPQPDLRDWHRLVSEAHAMAEAAAR